MRNNGLFITRCARSQKRSYPKNTRNRVAVQKLGTEPVT